MSTIDLHKVALDYHKQGWNVLPVRGKRPTISGWKQWQTKKQDIGWLNMTDGYFREATGIAVVCGRVSANLVVIDLDGHEAITLFHHTFPHLCSTHTVKTGKGKHLYFTFNGITDDLQGNYSYNWEDNAKTGYEVRIQVQNCYVIAPPSKHPTGAIYTAMKTHKDDIMQADLMEVIKWIETKNEAKREASVLASSIETAQNPSPPVAMVNNSPSKEVDPGKLWGQTALANELQVVSTAGKGGRNDQLYKSSMKMGSIIAGGYLTRSQVESSLMTGADLCGLVADDGKHACEATIRSGLDVGMKSPRHPSNDSAPLPSNGSKPDLDKSPEDKKSEDYHPLPYKPDEEQIATYVRSQMNDQYRFFRSSWHEYCDGVWTPIKNLDSQLTTILKGVRARKVKVTRNAISGVNFFLQTYLELPDDSIVDNYPQYINVKNGLFNLDTMQLEAHSKDVYVTTQANFDYDKSARPNVFVDWLKSMLLKPDGKFDRDLMCLVQEAMGYSLTADTRHRISFWLKGPAHSGKSTLLRALVSMMGSHHETLDLNQLGTNRFLLARIAGKRLVTFGEADAQTRLADGMYKMLVDNGGEVTADIKNREPISFVPQCKVWWAMNNYPYIGDRSGAVHSRVVIIPFHRSIPQDDWDLDLDDKIQAELAGVFNFALAGLQRLRANKRFTKVEQSELLKADLQRDSDIYAAFYDDPQWVKQSGKTEPMVLYRAFEVWAKANGIRNFASNITIKREWERIGLVPGRTGSGRFYDGISLTPYAERISPS